MQYLWELEKGFLKDIVEAFPEPRPAYTTISTVIRVLVKKGFIGFEKFGKVNRYHPMISKKEYSKSFFKGLLKRMFNSSPAMFTSFFAQEEDLSLSELEEMKAILESQIEKRKEEKQ